MAKKVAVSLDFLGNEIQQFVVYAKTSAPTGKRGMMYYNINDKVLYYHNGTIWKALATGGDLQNIKNFSKVMVGTTEIAPDDAAGTLTFAGENVTLTPDATNDKITIKITDANVAAALGFSSATAMQTAYTNQNAFGKISDGGTGTVTASSTSSTVTIKGSDGAIEVSASDSNDTVTVRGNDVTDDLHGLMTPEQKAKLDGIEAGATADQNIFASISGHSGGTVTANSTNTAVSLTSDVITITADDTNKTIKFNVPAATTGASGLMSAADKIKLNGIAAGAEVNQNAFSNVKVGSTTVAADSKTDTLELVGSNVTLTPDATNAKVTIGITQANVTAALGYTPPRQDTTYAEATQSTSGLMSAADKTKLDNLSEGQIVGDNLNVTEDADSHTITIGLPAATATQLGGVRVDSAMSATSTNPVQNKVIKAAIDSLNNTIGSQVASVSGENAINVATTSQNAKVTLKINTASPGDVALTQDANGLKADAPDYTVAKLATPTTGYDATYQLNKAGTAVSGSVVDIPAYEIAETTASAGYLKTYQLKKNGTFVGTKIDIPKDLVVTGGAVVNGTFNSSGVFTETTSGTDKAIKLTIANQTSPIYINVKDLVDVYTAGTAITIDSTNKISVNSSTVNGWIDTKINALDSTKSGSSASGQITVKAVQTDGKLTSVTVTAAQFATQANFTDLQSTVSGHTTTIGQLSALNGIKVSTAATSNGTLTIASSDLPTGAVAVDMGSVKTYYNSAATGVIEEVLMDISSTDGLFPTVSWNGFTVSEGDTIVVVFDAKM